MTHKDFNNLWSKTKAIATSFANVLYDDVERKALVSELIISHDLDSFKYI